MPLPKFRNSSAFGFTVTPDGHKMLWHEYKKGLSENDSVSSIYHRIHLISQSYIVRKSHFPAVPLYCPGIMPRKNITPAVK